MGKSRNRYRSVWEWILILLLIAPAGCIKRDFNSIDTVNYKPELALPIGFYTITVDQMIEDKNLHPVDPEDVPDGVLLIRYYDTYYESPTSYDTTITLNLQLNLENDYEQYIDYLIIRSNFINYSHASSSCQMYFKNEDGTPFDSLFSEGPLLIEPGQVNSNGTIKKNEFLRNDEWFDEDRINRLINGSFVDIKITFSFKQKVPVIWYTSDQLMWIQLGMRLGLDVETSEFK